MTKQLDGLVKPFLDHLEDLRRTLLLSVAALSVGVAVAIPCAPYILMLLKRPLVAAGRNPDTFLRVLEIAGGLSIAMSIVLWTGVLISAPVIVILIGHFIFPGLRARERKVVLAAAAAGVLLFALGVSMGALILPKALLIMFSVNEWMHIQTDYVLVTDYVSFTLKLLLVFGLMFELPLLILAFGWMGFVSSRQLREWRNYVIVAIFIIAAVVTPTSDPFTMCLMAGPMTALFELCIWILHVHEKRNA